MRVIAGLHKGRRLETPDSKLIRPTSDKVKGAIFNALQSRKDLTDLHVIDGFCGTGALGIEALSRGAAYCTFIDKSHKSLSLTRHNLSLLDLAPQSSLMRCDITKIKTAAADYSPAELLLLDPPYAQDFLGRSLVRLIDGGWLKSGCLCVCETAKNFVCTDIPPSLKKEDEKIYGDTKIEFWLYDKAPV